MSTTSSIRVDPKIARIIKRRAELTVLAVGGWDYFNGDEITHGGRAAVIWNCVPKGNQYCNIIYIDTPSMPGEIAKVANIRLVKRTEKECNHSYACVY
jgi:hypothetical protein